MMRVTTSLSFGVLLIAVVAFAAQDVGLVNAEKAPVVYCYWGTWAYYRPGNGQFRATDIDPTLCTHIGYAFFGLSEKMEMISLDTWLDFDLENIKQAVALKRKNPALKVLAAIGGWNEGSVRYSAMAANATSRATFISSAVAFLLKYGFDGLDCDWEYPAQRGGLAADRQNYVTLLRELKMALAAHDLLLTVAVAAAEPSASLSYDIPSMSKYVDLIQIMAYDFTVASEGHLGFNTPLYGTGPNTVAAGVAYWLKQGAPAHKIVVGLAFYGHSFALNANGNTTVGASSPGPGTAGPYTRQAGILGYNEVCDELQNGTITRQWDVEAEVPYAYNHKDWISYDDPQSLTLKVEFARSLKVGGVMVWSIETDDFRGVCGPSFPLLNTINKQLKKQTPPTSTAPNSTTTTTQRRTIANGHSWLTVMFSTVYRKIRKEIIEAMK